jgi:ubiquitin C-terminal hydrolase
MNQNSNNNNNLNNLNNGNNNNNENNMNLNSQNNKNIMANNMNNSMNNNVSNMQLNNQNNINNNQMSNMNNNQMSNMNNNPMNNMNNNSMNNMNNNPMGNMNNNPMGNMNNNQMSNMNNNPMGNMNQISNQNMGMQNQNMGMQNQNMGMQNQNMNNNKEPYSFSRYKKASKTSLKNLGDTSYLNAVFQLLGTVRNLSSYFVNPKNTTSFEKNVNSAGFSYVVHRFFTHIYPYPEKQVPEKYKPEALLTYLGKLNKVYMSTKRRNPNDLITFCLNQLHRELNQCKTKHLSNPNFLDKENVIKTRLSDYTKSNNSIIANNFHWFEIKTRYCGSCNTNFYEFKDFETLELDISEAYKQFKQPFTLLQCLTFQSKKFQNSFCQKCGIYTQNQILSNIYSSPITFIFSLNRGNLDPNLLNINFIVEENIDISQFLENKRSYSKYSLCGIVSISRKENNKYVCFGKSPVDKQWYLYNDEMVTDTNINYIIQYNNNQEYIPCILLYQFIKQ